MIQFTLPVSVNGFSRLNTLPEPGIMSSNPTQKPVYATSADMVAADGRDRAFILLSQKTQVPENCFFENQLVGKLEN